MSTVREIADQVFAYRLQVDTYIRTRRGIPIEGFRRESVADWQADADFATKTLATLRSVPVDTEDDRLTVGFLEHVLGGWVDRAKHAGLGFTVTPYSSFFLTMGLQQAFTGYEGPDSRYLSLVADLRDQVIELRSRLLNQRESGVLLPAPAIAGTLESLRRARAASAGLLPGSAPESCADQVRSLVEREVLPAYDELLGVFNDDYVSAAPTTVGMSQWAGGEEYYRSLVRTHTASDLTPEQLHQMGLEQVAYLADRMAKVRADLGFGGSEAEFHAQLATDPRVHAKEASEVEALFLRHMSVLEPKIGKWFSVLPKATYGVARLDPELEAGMTYGYYEPPTPTMPVGRYRWNGANLESKSLLTYAALIFHELAPGHHFHLARQSENVDIPDVRRESLDIGAFNEGWAEYAAGLGWEMGLYEDPLDAYGRLVHERFTAQRLVVDTGMNLMGWTLEQGAAYMRANTTESDGQIATEVLRYSTDLPGQALAYRAGFVEFNRIRENAETALGSRFDIKDFHEQILGPGALPFPVINSHVERWISQH